MRKVSKNHFQIAPDNRSETFFLIFNESKPHHLNSFYICNILMKAVFPLISATPLNKVGIMSKVNTKDPTPERRH